MAGQIHVKIGLTEAAVDVIDVLDELFALIDDYDEQVPEWNTFEKQRLEERRNDLATRASKLMTSMEKED